MKEIKTEEERARLDELFAQVEKELHETEQNPENQHETDLKNRRNSLEKKRNENPAQTIGNVNAFINDNVFKTKREEYLAWAFKKLYEKEVPKVRKERSALRCELEVLRNFAKAVAERLENAERTAKEQDNHHYYKIFAESVKILLEKI